MTHTEARELANQFGSRMCDENGETHGEELYCFSLEDIIAIKEALAQPEQEPVAIKRMKEWIEYLKRKSDFGQHMKIPSEMSAGACWELAIELEQFINTTPPQRKPLTEDELADLWYKQSLDWLEFARAIEAAHNIKENT